MSNRKHRANELIAELDALLGEPPLSAELPPVPMPAMAAASTAVLAPAELGVAAPLTITLLPPPPVAPPAPAPEPAAAAPAAAAAPPTRQPRLLLVDDSDDYRETVRFLLSKNGFDVIEAANGAEGLRLARSHRPDVVLLDYNMPQMNGYELVQELRREVETRSLPLIMFTGSPHRGNLKSVLPDVFAFLDKPVSNARLLSEVRRALPPLPLIENEPAKHAAPPAPEIEERVDDFGSADELLVDSVDEKKEDEGGLEVLANDSPLVSRVNKILLRAVELGASDVHIEPQERELIVRVRVNGALQRLCAMPLSLATRLTARVKIMSNLVITERRLPQDGQIRATIRGKKVEFRVSTLPSLHGEKIVMRVLGGGKLSGSLADSGLCARDLACVEYALRTPHGLILVTGPTGSGKSTTLYTMIRMINTPDVNIMTAEDPVEYELPGITQVPVRSKIGLTFESVLRSFLRQDPDIMLVGEIRDLETAEIAVKAAVTGHLVFSTLHTNSAPATIMRLAHMGLAPYLLAASVKLVIAQRLVRSLCESCRIPQTLSDADRQLLSDAEAASIPGLFRGVGCARCSQTGYKGRIPLFEVMPVRTPEMRHAIMSSESGDRLAELAVKEGMTALRRSALDAVAAGRTSLGEAMKVMAD